MADDQTEAAGPVQDTPVQPIHEAVVRHLFDHFYDDGYDIGEALAEALPDTLSHEEDIPIEVYRVQGNEHELAVKITNRLNDGKSEYLRIFVVACDPFTVGPPEKADERS